MKRLAPTLVLLACAAPPPPAPYASAEHQHGQHRADVNVAKLTLTIGK